MQNKIPVICMLDPLGVIQSGGLDVWMRQARYAETFSQFKSLHGFKLIIISREKAGTSHGNFSTKNMEIFFVNSTRKNWIKFILKSRLMLKQEYEIKAFISGDPWVSFFVTKIFQNIFYKGVEIQAQIHADVGDIKWRRASFKNKVKTQIMKYSLHFANQVRIVNKDAEYFLRHFIFKYRGEFVYAPVPIATERFHSKKIIEKNLDKKSVSIGFLGRIELDRGIKDFIKFIGRMVELDLIGEVHIAGDGSKIEYFENALRCYEPSISVFFYGYLNEESQLIFWKNINIFVSMAESESFGRAIRESLLHGVPIWAAYSNGLNELIETIPKEWFAILNLNDIPDTFRSKVDQLKLYSGEISYLEWFEEFQDENMRRLLDSWCRLVRNG